MFPISFPGYQPANQQQCTTEGCDRLQVAKGLCQRCYTRRWQQAHPEKQAEYVRRWHQAHPDKVIAHVRRWKAAHPDRVAEYAIDSSAKQRATKYGAPIIESVMRSEVWRRDGGICGICQQPADPTDWQMDHKLALALGGEHSYANVQVSHPACNRAKGKIERQVKKAVSA